jgi:hypothetical protein
MTTAKEQLDLIERDIEAVRTELLDAFDEHRLACEAKLRELLELKGELQRRMNAAG